MKQLTKVVWSEGMHLGPHHFQVQSRFFEDSVQFVTSALSFATYGVIAVEFDPDALQNGTLSLLYARGIFPDGLVFYMPEYDALPPTRNITELLSPTHDSATIHLASPAYKLDGLNYTVASNGDFHEARYTAEPRLIHDETTGQDEKQVLVGRKNLTLLLETEVTGDMETLPIGRVMRSGSGGFELDAKFIPPCLQITASSHLMAMLGQLLEILEAKAGTLSRREKGSAYSASEVASFWLLHSICSSLPLLRHLYFTKHGHPEEVYRIMAELAGALCTFGLNSDPAKLPGYNHNNLGDCFKEIDQHVRAHLETIIPTNITTFALEQIGDCFYRSAVTDDRALGPSRWIFAMRSPIGDADLITKTPGLVKVCSNQFIGKIVQRAVSGLALIHLPMPPSAVSPRIDTQYFALNKAGPCWDHIVQTREIGIYVPGDFPTPELQLFAVLEA
jgi:type VI secretion system protein ImpJ